MTASPVRESATIYQFPARGRFAVGGEDANATPRYAKTAFGGSWYHEEAIQEERAQKKS